jgi:hypothetical protein
MWDSKVAWNVIIQWTGISVSVVTFGCLQGINALKPSGYCNVTCQPFVGLRNRTLLGSRPLSASRPSTRYAAVGEAVLAPCRFEPREGNSRPQWRHTAARSLPRKRRVNTVTWRNSVDWLRFRSTGSGYISEVVSSFSSVFKEQSYESVFKRGSMSEF